MTTMTRSMGFCGSIRAKNSKRTIYNVKKLNNISQKSNPNIHYSNMTNIPPILPANNSVYPNTIVSTDASIGYSSHLKEELDALDTSKVLGLPKQKVSGIYAKNIFNYKSTII